MTSRHYISSKFTSTFGEIAEVSSIKNVVALSLLWVISLIIHCQKGRPEGLTQVMISALAHVGFLAQFRLEEAWRSRTLRRRRWRWRMDLSSAWSKSVILVSE